MKSQWFVMLAVAVVFVGTAGAMTGSLPDSASGMALVGDTPGSGDGLIYIVPAMSAPSLKNGETAAIQAVVKAAAGVAAVEARIEPDSGMPLCFDLPVATLRLTAAGTSVGSALGLWKADWTAHGLEEGYYRVAITVTDAAGHTYTDRSLRFSDPVAGNTVVGTTSYPNGGLRRMDSAVGILENNIGCAIVDAINGYAWFGTTTSPGKIIKVALGTGYTPPVYLGSLTLNAGENNLVSAVYDHTSETGYFGTDTSPIGIVVKVQLGSGPALPTYIGALPLLSGESSLYCAVIDNATQYAYFGTNTVGAKVVKIGLGIGLTPFSRIGSVTLNSMFSENYLRCAVIDVTNGYAYFGTNTAPGRVVKVSLGAGANPPTRIGSLGLGVGYDSLSTAVISVSSQFAWFGTNTLPGRVVKINLNGALTPTFVGAVTLNAGEGNLTGATIDVANQAAWFATNTTPGNVVKVDIGAGNAAPARIGAIALSAGENLVTCGGIDVFNGYAYYGTNTTPAQVVRVALSQKGFVKGTRFTMPEPGLLDSVSFYSHLSAGDVRLGLYDTAASPNLIWEGPATLNATANDWMTTTVGDGLPASLLLTAGNYYLAWQVYTTASVPSHTVGAANEGFLVPYEWNGFPAALQPATPTEQVMTTDRWSAYITYTGPPNVQSVTVLDGHTVRVTFNKDMSADAELAATYTLSGSGQGSLAATPDSVTEISPTEYDLSWSCPVLMRAGGDITVTVASTLTDTLGIPMGLTQSGTHTGGAAAVLPTVTLVPNTEPVIGECSVALVLPVRSWVDGCGTAIGETAVNLGGLDIADPQAGNYTVTLTATDGVGNVGTKLLPVEIHDTVAPVITLLGNAVETVECAVVYADAGATAADDCDGVLTGSIVTVNPVNTAVVGSYTVTYNVSDAASNAAVQVTRTVNVVDTTVPAISLNGSATVDVQCGAVYADAGATASDTCSGDLTGMIVTVNPVNTAIKGSYTVTYNVSDAASNAALEATRTVNVIDTTVPIITLLGNPIETVQCGTAYSDAGASAADVCDGDITGSIITVNPVNTGVVGSYTVTYNVSDAASNAAAQVTRTVNVVDTTAPIITLLGNAAETVECGDAYTDAGATAADVCNGDLTASIITVNSVNTGVVGSYTVTYNVSDAASNAAAQVTRTVNVVDTTAPIITLLGNAIETVQCGTAYSDAGASAADVCDGDITGSIITVNPVNIGVVGSYTVTYDVSDGALNAAAQVTRTVNVVDTAIPVITLLGNNPETVQCGAVYADAGATAADDCDGVLTGSIVTVDSVNTAVVGSYTVTYNVSDAASNAAAQVARTVNVVDTTAPIITLLGNAVETVQCGAVYADAGATAADGCDGDITGVIVTVNSVNTAVAGSYTVTYNVSDTASNAAVEVVRTVNVVDTTVPVITLLGNNPETVECGAVYADAGATATDICSGDLTGAIVVVNPVNTAVKGSYTVTYNVSDGASNAAVQVTRTVNVTDTTAPVIIRNGASPVTAECGSVYSDAGATAADICDGVLTPSIITFNPVNINIAGTYTVRYNVSDSASNAAAEVTRTVNVVDTTAPVITMLGDALVIVECGAVYTDAGATAVDGCDGSLTGAIVTVNPVNTAVPAVYTVTYNVSDSAANNAVQRSRTVQVVDTTAPVITLLGNNPETVECGAVYTDAGATALDINEGDLTASIVVVNPVNTAIPGAYIVRYNVSDSFTNAAAEVQRTVNVVDTTAPAITRLGNNPETVECGTAYTDAGATAADSCGGDLTASIAVVNPVNTAVPGSYTVTYNVSDGASNAALQVTRTVNVVDTTAPVITLLGNNPATVECGAAYTDAGATAADSCGGDLTASIVVVNPVNTAVPGSYTVTYNVSDSASNAAVQVTRTVNVADTAIPVITLLGSPVVTVNLNDTYTDAGATAADSCNGDLTASIITVNPVNTAVVGSYTVTYNVSDTAANAAVQVTRTVNVVDTTQPYVTSVNVLSVNSIEVVFSKSMGTGANVPANYTVSGTGMGTLTPNPGSVAGAGTTWTLSWAGCPIMRAGGDITVTVAPIVEDALGNVMTAPFDGTDLGGGTAVLPVITRSGTSPVTVQCGSVYTDAGATAVDQCGTSLTASIVTVNPVLAGTPGSYTVTYNVSDAAGNAAVEVTRTVNVVDTVVPVITRNGSGSLAVQCGSTYTDAGATATDACSGDLTSSIVTVNPVNTGVPGSYIVTYNVSDGAANAAVQVTRTVNVVDTTPPMITLLGSSPISVQCGTAYADAGATANDICGGNLTASIVTVNPVNTAVPGAYAVTYDVSDAAANAAIQVTRTVNVVDTSIPVITRLGDAVVSLECGSAYTDAGATALDTCDGDLSASIVTVNPVNASVVGSYTVTYNVSDGSANAAVQVTRTVNVVDTTAPVITLNGITPTTAQCGMSYTDAGATAADACGGNLTSSIVVVNPVNTSVMGAYTVTYNVSDSAANAAVQVTRTVNVVDTTPPVITRLGNAIVTVECGSTYTDAGATAADACYGNLTAAIVRVNPVNTSVKGSYTVTYNVSDTAANAAVQVTRTVNVVDTQAPVITLLGSPTVTVNLNDTYVDAGATAADGCDGNLTGSIVTVNPVDTSTLGTYTVRYNVTDSSMNAAVQVTRTVNVVDTANPFVASVTVRDGHTVRVVFSKSMGAGALLAANYTLSGTGRGTLATTPEGVTMVSASTYDLTWNCPAIMRNGGHITITVNATLTDSSGNPIVAPLAATHTNGATAQLPQITLVPNVTELIGECSVALVQPSRTAVDACGNTASFLTTYNFDGLVFSDPDLGTYALTYRAQDAAGNIGTRGLTVYIEDTTPPVITLLGDNPQVIDMNDPYVEQGATAADVCEGNVTAGIVVDASAVNTNAAGTYTVTYNVQDSEGNAAAEVTRTVNVIDNSIPLTVAPIADIEIAEGGSGSLSAIPDGGTGTITYQWLKDDGTGTFLPLSEGSGYTGTQTATLTLDSFIAAMAGLYKVEVSDDLITVEATANVTLAIPQVPAAGLLGILALASATALAGARALRRRR